MSWSAPSAANVLTEFTPAESTMLKSVQAGDNLAGILSRVVAEIRDYIRSGGYPLATDATTIPLGLHNDAIAIARWRFLISVADLPDLQTEARKAAAERALDKLDKIASQKFAVEPPTTTTPDIAASGSWNSENKVLGRTHPTPRPGVQVTPADNGYANPDGPADQALDS